MRQVVGGGFQEVEKEVLRALTFSNSCVWVIRNELIRGNINEMNVYANEMLKEKNFENVTVADDNDFLSEQKKRRKQSYHWQKG